jgi:TPR repeat protein
VWAVPVANLSELKMSSGSGAVGKTDFSITLVTVAGDVLAVSNSSLVVGGPGQGIQATASVQQADQVEATREPTEPAVKLLPPQPTGKALERVMLYMEKGEASLKSGNLNVARAFFTQAAEEGWAEGALALGATYDPVELANMRLLGGVGPDPAMAKRWYETAAQLGSKAATTRLQRMTER